MYCFPSSDINLFSQTHKIAYELVTYSQIKKITLYYMLKEQIKKKLDFVYRFCYYHTTVRIREAVLISALVPKVCSLLLMDHCTLGDIA